MGLLDKIRRSKGARYREESLSKITINGVPLSSIPDEPIDPEVDGTYGSDSLCSNGELPLGWVGRHYNELKGMEENVTDHVEAASNRSKPVDERIAEYETAIDMYDAMRDRFVAAGECYAKYFSDMWEHCHNSRCADFVYIEPIKEELAQLRENYEALKKRDSLLMTLDIDLIDHIKNSGRVLQADVYKSFDPVLKTDIKDRLYTWSKEGRILREKCGRSYLVSLPDPR